MDQHEFTLVFANDFLSSFHNLEQITRSTHSSCSDYVILMEFGDEVHECTTLCVGLPRVIIPA